MAFLLFCLFFLPENESGNVIIKCHLQSIGIHLKEIRLGFQGQKDKTPSGDSFTQFRFADEKEWEAENPSQKQASAVCLDLQSLGRVLQELPLYLRLNVEAELVQEALPQELPHFKTKGTLNLPPVTRTPTSTAAVANSTQVETALPQERVLNATKAAHNSSPLALDEELDFLLSLEAPVKEVPGVQPSNENKESDLHEKSEVTDVATSSDEKEKTVTEEDLEDWLDSMIS
ncbi:hypothetical protein XELAEV_18039976mg [Xenopus laevis]|uniref:Cell death regulator Aven n=1 Tax=Xenopus laevis TaxID=8355 RepID=A0A974H8H8_XENLA|nr:hypothetical protein XELAEV_18039976mg [Xenopus laevis]